MSDKNKISLTIKSIEDFKKINEEEAQLVKRITLYCQDYQLEEVIDFSIYCNSFSRFTNQQKLCIIFRDNEGLNQIKGLDQLFKQIENLNSLELFFENSSVETEIFDHLIESLQQLENLNKLYFDFYLCQKLLTEHIQQISQIISKNLSLKKLKIDLGWNMDLRQQAVNFISNSLKDLLNLKVLYLSFHYLDCLESLENLNKNIKNLVNLENLTIILGGCDIKKDDINKLFSQIKQLNKVKILHLDASQCDVDDKSVAILGSSLQNCQFLSQFIIQTSSNSNIQQFGQDISKLSKIQQLNLNFYYSKNLKFGPFGSYKKDVNNLEKLTVDLKFCSSICKENLKSFVSDFKFFVNLKELNINLENCTQFDEELYDQFILQLQNKKHLVSVSFDSFFTTNQEKIIKLTQSLKQIKSLRKVQIIQPCIPNLDDAHSYLIKKAKKLLFKYKYLVCYSYS